MTVEQAKVVDAVGTNSSTGRVHLTIVDHLEWDTDHLVKLQEKLNSYLAFVESGEIHAVYPASMDRDVAIDLVLKYRPNAEAEAFLAQARSIIEGAGLALHYGPLQAGYANDNV